MSAPPPWAERVHQLLLIGYPARFRAEFGDEMQCVFAAVFDEARRRGWQSLSSLLAREIKDWPGAVLQAHLQTRKNKMTKYNPFAPLTRRELWAALMIFLIPIIGALLSQVLSAFGIGQVPDWAGIILAVIFLGSLLIPLILGIIRGFPLWSFPYLGVLLVGSIVLWLFWRVWESIHPSVTGWLGNMYSWSLPVRIFVQGMQAAVIWLLVLLAVFLLVSLLRLIPHTRAIWRRARQDWTQLSFIIYGGLIIHVLIIFDEYRGDVPWLMAAWLVLAAGCWLYLHASEPTQRILILLGGASLAMWIVAAGKLYLVPFQNWAPWFARYPPETERWFESLRTLADWFCLVAALMVPALLNLLPQKPIVKEEPALA